MATTQTSGGVKKIRNGKRATVQDAGIAAARLRRSGAAPAAAAPTETTRPPSMIPAVPVAAAGKREELMRIDALERDNAQLRAKVALMEGTIEYLRIHSAWPAEWVVAHGGAVEPGPDDPVEESEQETVEITEGNESARATEEVPAAEETTPAADTETPSEVAETSDPEPSAS